MRDQFTPEENARLKAAFERQWEAPSLGNRTKPNKWAQLKADGSVDKPGWLLASEQDIPGVSAMWR